MFAGFEWAAILSFSTSVAATPLQLKPGGEGLEVRTWGWVPNHSDGDT